MKGLAWLGIPAGDYAAAVRFFGETLGLEVAFDEGNTCRVESGSMALPPTSTSALSHARTQWSARAWARGRPRR